MTNQTNCSKPKGQYCRLHNPAPSVLALQKKITEYETKVSALLEPPFNTEAEIESLNDELQLLTNGVIRIERETSLRSHDIYNVHFDAEHDLVLLVAYPKDGGNPTRAIDYGFSAKTDYSKKNLTFEQAFSERNLSDYASENPYYPSDISMSKIERSKSLRTYHEERTGVSFYTPPVNGNRRINYDGIEYVNEQYEGERAKVAECVTAFFKKLDRSKGIK